MIANGLIMWLLAELANLSKNMTLSIGGIANDRVIITIDRYFAGELSKEQTLGVLKYEKPNIQYCFCSDKMLNDCVTFIKSIRL